jgi:hypothetical protein
MKRALVLAVALGLAGLSTPVWAQQTDYLTAEEITKVRDTQEPNERVQLFLEFAQQRLLRFEEALAPATETHPDDLRDLLNDFINAVDDTAEALDFPLQRGGVDLRKTHKKMEEAVPALLARVQEIQKARPELAEGDLRYDLQDATMATEDLLELVKNIPDEPIPPRQPALITGDTEGETPAPGKPTLKRRPPEEREKPD